VYGADLCYTPLHYAVFNNLLDIMRVLFKYNCDVLLRTPAGEIAKDLAIEKDNPETINLLDSLISQQEEERMAYIEVVLFLCFG
jgi:ankyrin repeat protein